MTKSNSIQTKAGGLPWQTINEFLARRERTHGDGSAGTPWNKGRLVGAKLALKPKHVWALRFTYSSSIVFGNLPCWMWPSTASYAGAMS